MEIDKLSKSEQKLMMNVGRTYYEIITLWLLENGKIKENDLQNRALIAKKVQEILKKDNNVFVSIVDHRDTIKQAAIVQHKNEHLEFSLALYGTIIEHTLNSILDRACRKKKMSEDTIYEIVRSNIYPKCTWLIEVLNLPPFAPKHKKAIKDISDKRNQFIHYKWKAGPDELDEYDKEIEVYQKLIKQAKSTIKYLRTYETRLAYSGKKDKLKKALK